MKEELVTFDTAKLAKEKGFNIPCRNVWAYHKNAKKPLERYYDHGWVLDELIDVIYSWEMFRPTQSLLQKWLREVHDIKLCISWVEDKLYNSSHYLYEINHKNHPSVGGFKTYEEALEEGLQEALKLI